MKPALLAAVALTLALGVPSYAAKAAPSQTVKAPKVAAPGGAPDKVWVNLITSKYHCFGDRYYGKTSNGRYMTEKAARMNGAKGPHGGTCDAH